MKDIKYALLCIGIALLLLSCNEEKSLFFKNKKAHQDISQKDVNVENESVKSFLIADNVSSLVELKGVEPATNEELIMWLPNHILNFKRIAFFVDDKGLGDIVSITGKYAHEVNDDIRFDVNVIDGAGGSGEVFTMVYVSQFSRDFEELHEDGYSKSIKKNNVKAIVTQNDQYKTAEVEYLESKRYYIKFSGRSMNVDELWKVTEVLKTEELPGL